LHKLAHPPNLAAARLSGQPCNVAQMAIKSLDQAISARRPIYRLWLDQLPLSEQRQ
jgi:hypothetical protein